MKSKTKISILTVVLIMATQVLHAQWETTGNIVGGTDWFGAQVNSTEAVRFEHRANDPASRFEWYTTDGNLQEVMRLDRNGYLGVGALETRSRITIAPLSLVPGVNNGGYRAWMQEGIYMYSGLFNDGGSDICTLVSKMRAYSRPRLQRGRLSRPFVTAFMSNRNPHFQSTG